MLAILRVFLLALAVIIISIAACLVSFIRPFHRNNVYLSAKYMGKVAYLLGLTVEIRIDESIKKIAPVVYIANHQNSFDMFTVSSAVQPNTVSVGKKSLKWIPFFGQMYWLTGNILIDRNNTNKAMGTIEQTAKKIKDKKLSVWLFPEGTRSNGRGLLRFKTGAFRTAIQADVPIVPICASNLCNVIKLNRWNNGKVIIEFLPPIDVSGQRKEKLRQIVDETQALMKAKIQQLSIEAGTYVPESRENETSIIKEK